MRIGVLVPAAGLGVRLGGDVPKALRLLAGEPLLLHAVRGLLAAPGVGHVVVAVPAAQLASAETLLGGSASVVVGGASRRESVALALAALDPDCDVVLVHDAARPFVPVALVCRVAAAVEAGAPAVVPGLAVSDTIKRVDAGGWVAETPPRESLRAVQTPQGFRREVLEAAHAQPGGGAVTDDAGLVELLGLPVLVVEGDPLALKVTTSRDLALLEMLAP